MSTVALILPDFLLIAAGFVLRRATPLGSALWPGTGGDGRTAATLVSYGVAASLVTLPLWLAVVSGTSG